MKNSSKLSEELRQELADAVDRFISYGAIMDRQTRRYIAAWVQEKLVPGVADLDELDPEYFRYFEEAIGYVLEDELLQEICQSHSNLAVQIVKDMLVWFRRSFSMIEEGHPYEHEQVALESWTVRPMEHVFERWGFFRKTIANYYTSDEIDSSYHSFRVSEIKQENTWGKLSPSLRVEIERLFDDLLRQWDAMMHAKILAFRLKRADKLINDLGENLLGKAKEFKQLNELIEPFAGYASRYWDLSRDLWSDSSFDVIEKYRDLLEKEDEIKALADMLGKMRQADLLTEEDEFTQITEYEAETRDPNRKEEVIGVFESNDLNHLISSEAALLADEATESIFLKKFADQALLTQQFETKVTTSNTDQEKIKYERTKKKEKGPFIICVDTSGSMEGKPEMIAKVLCFAIMKMASAENRRAYLINFSTGIKTLDLLNISDDLDGLAEFLRMSFMGGTDISLALHEALTQLQEESYEDADVLVISDFIMYKLDSDVSRRMEFQQVNHNTRFHSLIISDEGNQAIIDLFDNVWFYDPNQKGILRSIRNELAKVVEDY
ncbi:VWA domain-containing protein [Sanyastnella coralliicola]|uniref:VWA domain-containing protein n=1 Tax=Sanyastnella coralliicola TaxID=3069118 RepID=UPI0027B8F683|nr:VWA domain-containing protein [Longitalea sp. SCSIO 12813]